MTERLIFVDENDQPIGVGDRHEAWAKGIYTRNIRVMLRDENGRILSQKRSVRKDTYPGMWTVAASGHVDESESWDSAARRETQEEIGVSADLTFVGNFSIKQDEGDKKIRQILRVYEGTIDSKSEFRLEKDEVDDIRWYEIGELKTLVTKTPEQFTPSFIQVIEKFY